MSEQESQTKRSEKRRELFKQQQQQMLAGYNLNSFKSSKPKKSKTKKDADKKPDTQRQPKADEIAQQITTNHGKKDLVGSNYYSNQTTNQSKQQQEFAEILDQMSMNSSSKLNLQKSGNIKIQYPPTRKDQIRREMDSQNLNLSKSQSGYIRSILKGQEPIDMKIQDASLTINTKKNNGQNALNSLLDKSEIQIEMNDDEFNRRQFKEENPYGDSQKLNMTDYQQHNLKKQNGSLRQRESNDRGRRSKPSPFEKYEEIRFQCYELQEKIGQMNTLVQTLTSKIGTGENINFEKQTMEVPLDFIEQMASYTQKVSDEYGQIQSKWNNNFDDQQRSNSRQKSKRKQMKKRLKSMENRSQIAVDQQKEFEQSLYQISNAHNVHTNQMGMQLDQIETQVNSLKYTREILNGKYENQLDHAYGEMINFYENIEKDPKEIDSDNMSIEQVFFIKPTHQISQSIKQRSKSHLRLSNNNSSINKSNQPPVTRSNSVTQQQRTPNIVPKLQIERMQDQKSPEPPRIISKKKKSQRGSSRQYQQTSQRSNQQPPKQKDRNVCPSGRISNRNEPRCSGQAPTQVSQRGSARETSKKYSKKGSDQIQASKRSLNKTQNEPVEDFVTNPVMVGAMKLPESKFDNQYEDDFEGANVTLDMATERLRQFPEDYEAVNSIGNPDERILLKQVVFMKYERILKKQAKTERKKKKKALKQQKLDMEQDKTKQNMSSAKKSKEGTASGQGGELHYKPKSLIPTPTHKSSFGFGKFQNQQSSKGSLRGLNHQSSNSSIGTKNVQKGLGKNERHEYNDNSQLTSRFSLHSALSGLDTVDFKMAQQKYKPQDVNKTELIECEEDMAYGLKTATQASLIQHYEDEFEKKDLMRAQLKQEEKKIEYNSTQQSKMSIAMKQMSCGSKQPDILKQYASNNSNQQHPIFIHESVDHSMNDEFKDVNKISYQKVPKCDQNSIKSNRNTSHHNSKAQIMDNNRSFNNVSGIEHSMNISLGQLPDDHQIKEEDQKILLNYLSSKKEDHAKPLLTVSDHHQPLTHPTEMGGHQTQVADESMASSHYQRYIDINNEYQESPIVKNSKIQDSYINSDATPISQSNQEQSRVEQDQQELDIDEFDPNQIYFDQIGGQFRQRLPLDIIHERQSEFSQSMITNAQRINTHRSMQNKKNYHYNNMNQNVSNQQHSVNTALPSNRLSDIHNQSSANRKNSSRGIQEVSFDKKTQDFAEEQYRSIMIRSSSVAQTHRNPDNSFVNPTYHNASINDQPICIDGSLIHQSRNQNQKISSSSKDGGSKKDLQMFRQPSAGNFEKERLMYFSNMDQEHNNPIKSNVKSQAQALKNKLQGSNQVPPTGKQAKQGSEKKHQNTRNNVIYQNTSNQQHTGLHIERSENAVKNVANQHQLSFRSQQNHLDGQSFREIRDRSYFDESPAIFDSAENELDHNPSISRDRCPEEKHTISSRHVENSINSNLQSVQVYRTEETGESLSNQKFGKSIQSNIIMQSIPQSSCQSSNRDSKSKQSKINKSKESKIESLNQIDSQHQVSADNSHKELMLNSNQRNHELDKINENLKENEDLGNESRLNYSKKGRPLNQLFRSNSFVQLRDKEFYEMCIDDEDIANVEQNLFEALQLKMLGQSKQNNDTNIHNQSSETSVQMFSSNILLNKLSQKYQTQEKSTIDQSVDPIGQTPSIVDQNSSQQNTRGQRTFAKFLQDPTRLLASINDRAGQPYNNPHIPNYLGTNLMTKSLDDGTLHLFNNNMNPSQYRKTLLMMCNLHNNHLHSANSGTLFTMQRAWNSGYIGDGNMNAQIGQSMNNLTNLIRSRKEFIINNQSTNGVSGVINGLHGLNNADKQGVTIRNGDQALKSLGGDPVNISSLLLGAKQQTTERINVGSITIVEDENKNLLDRKLYIDGNNSASQQTKGRKIFNQSRNQNGVTTSDCSNLQTKQLGIFKNRNSQGSMLNNKNGERKTSESINISQIINDKSAVNDQSSQEFQNATKSTPNHHKGCYGLINDSNGNLLNSDKENKIEGNTSNERLDVVNESKSTIKPGTVSSSNQTSFMNLLVGLKQIQKKTGGNSSHRSGSDISINPRDIKSAQNFRTISQMEPNSNPQEKILKIIKLQQQKNQMNLSSSMVSAKQLEHAHSNLAQLKSRSVPKGGPIAGRKMTTQHSTVAHPNQLINKVKLILKDSQKKQANIKQLQSSLQLSNNETIKNFNTINGKSNASLVAKLHQNQLSARSKAGLIGAKNQRTNSSCMVISQTRGSSNLSALLQKKNSNATSISSARGSSGTNTKTLKQNNVIQQQLEGSVFIDQHGKKYTKKKITMNQNYQSSHPTSGLVYVANMHCQ